jgi:hypothetical protein
VAQAQDLADLAVEAQALVLEVRADLLSRAALELPEVVVDPVVLADLAVLVVEAQVLDLADLVVEARLLDLLSRQSFSAVMARTTP